MVAEVSIKTSVFIERCTYKSLVQGNSGDWRLSTEMFINIKKGEADCERSLPHLARLRSWLSQTVNTYLVPAAFRINWPGISL